MKKIIFGFILGIIVSTVCVYAYSVNSGNISYAPKNENWNVDNVESAINDLYGNMLIRNMPYSSNQYLGDRRSNSSVSLSLEKGKYLIIAINNYTSQNSLEDSPYTNDDDSLIISSNECEKIMGKLFFSSHTQKLNNAYNRLYDSQTIWSCDFKNDVNVTVTYNKQGIDQGVYTMQTIVHSIKLH